MHTTFNQSDSFSRPQKDFWTSTLGSNHSYDSSNNKCASLTSFNFTEPPYHDQTSYNQSPGISSSIQSKTWSSKVNSNSNNNSRSATTLDFADVSPRPFETSFRTAIEKMKHTSESRLEMLGSEGSGGTRSRAVHTIRPIRRQNVESRMTTSQTYVPTDTVSECGWDPSDRYDSFQSPRQIPVQEHLNSSIHRPRRHLSSQGLDQQEHDVFGFSSKQTAPQNTQIGNAHGKGTWENSSQLQSNIQPVKNRNFYEASQKAASDMNLNVNSTWSSRVNDWNTASRAEPQNSFNWTSQSDVNRPVVSNIIMPTKIRNAHSVPHLSNGKKEDFHYVAKEIEENDTLVLPSVRDIIKQVEALTEQDPGSLHRPKAFSNNMTTSSYSDSYGTSHTSHNYSNKARTGGGSVVHPQKAAVNLHSAWNGSNGSGVHETTVMAHNSKPMFSTPSAALVSELTPKKYNQRVSNEPVSLRNRENSPARKAEQLTHLPLDYQKLREAFVEQRREIQKLRKEITTKDKTIRDLQSDIRIYEPWRYE